MLGCIAALAVAMCYIRKQRDARNKTTHRNFNGLDAMEELNPAHFHPSAAASREPMKHAAHDHTPMNENSPAHASGAYREYPEVVVIATSGRTSPPQYQGRHPKGRSIISKPRAQSPTCPPKCRTPKQEQGANAEEGEVWDNAGEDIIAS